MVATCRDATDVRSAETLRAFANAPFQIVRHARSALTVCLRRPGQHLGVSLQNVAPDPALATRALGKQARQRGAASGRGSSGFGAPAGAQALPQ